ncbi:MAG: hypothetical protein WD016_06315 [Balneolaceae bacterium]
MDEFNSRIDAKRKVLQIVNSSESFTEELMDLSSKSINRWQLNNEIEKDSLITKKLRLIANDLFFLSNISQQQISDNYILKSKEINEHIRELYQIVSQEFG